jgi:dipeptidyl aminopeptidase/acylaminoacyl peptidase
MIRSPIAVPLVAVMAFMPLSAPASARPMTPEDVARLETVGEMAVSPDGSRIAYTTVRLPDVTRGQRNGPATAQLRLAWGPDQLRDYLPASMDVADIAFSPDGRMVSFLWAENGGMEAVWGIPVDGGAQRKLGEVSGADVEDYAWSSDGRKLYMLAGPDVDRKRKAERDAGFDAVVFEEEPQLNRLFVARADGELDLRPRQIIVPGHVSAVQSVPGGRSLVVQTAPGPSVDDSYVSKRVALVDLADGTMRKLDTPGKIGDVEVSADGRKLSLIAATDQHDPAATTLYLVDIESGTMRALNAGAAEAAMDAEWTADGRLASVIHVGATSRLRIYNRDGSVESERETGPLVLASLDAGGNTLAIRADAPDHPFEIFVQDRTGFQRWTRHNPWLGEIDFGRQRTYVYSARDGQRIEGVLIEPVGGISKGGAPLILDVHGGPEAHETNGWNSQYAAPGQVAAGRGYAVFLPNYRGSTGYGTAFSKQHQRDYAGKEFDDLVDARQALVEAGIADPARVGITGGSYGGYATAWAATAQSRYFAAGVMFVGISNAISKFGTTEIPREMYLVHERANPWDEWQRMLERSPIYHASEARTPLLILAGEKDTRVDPGQSKELYRHIRTRTDTPVRLVLYPGEAHGNRRAAGRLDYNLRMMEWFDRYLLGKGGKGNLPPPRPQLPELPVAK